MNQLLPSYLGRMLRILPSLLRILVVFSSGLISFWSTTHRSSGNFTSTSFPDMLTHVTTNYRASFSILIPTLPRKGWLNPIPAAEFYKTFLANVFRIRDQSKRYPSMQQMFLELLLIFETHIALNK